MNALLAYTSVSISGDNGGLIHSLLVFLLVLLCGGVLWTMGWYLLKNFPPLAMTVWNGLFILIGGICLINFLLSLAGHPFIAW